MLVEEVASVQRRAHREAEERVRTAPMEAKGDEGASVWLTAVLKVALIRSNLKLSFLPSASLNAVS